MINRAHCIMFVELRPRWWVKPYLITLWFLCFMMGTRPDEKKVCDFISRRGIWVNPCCDIGRSIP